MPTSPETTKVSATQVGEGPGGTPDIENNTLEDVLAKYPPGKVYSISKFAVFSGGSYSCEFPDLFLFCESETCGGDHIFVSKTNNIYVSEEWKRSFVVYYCRHCQKTHKEYAIAIKITDSGKGGEVFKFGENPSFGPHLPTKLKKIINKDADWDLFSKGRKCESQGLGIAAFAYYRRVVENRKNELFDEIYKVAKVLGSPEEFLSSLISAKNDNQFSASVEKLKPGFPQALLLNGHDPLTLLHDALSGGLHIENDDVCLSLAQSIRRVLSELCERMTNAIKDDAELKESISTLVQYRQQKAEKKKASPPIAEAKSGDA